MYLFFKRHAVIIAILALALIVRLPHLNDSFWLDEAAQALLSARPFKQQLYLANDFQPPLLHLITFVSLKFCQAEWWLRLWGALIPALLTIWGIYLIGSKLISQKVGWLCALFLTLNSFHVFYSQELRPYSLSAFFAVWSWFFLLERLRMGTDSYQWQKNKSKYSLIKFLPITRDFFLYLLCSILGLFTTYLYPFVLASQLLYLLSKNKMRLFLYAFFVPLISFLPWLPYLGTQVHTALALKLKFPGWENIVSFSLLKAPTLTFGKFLFGLLDLEVNFTFLSLSFLFLLFLFYCLYHSRHRFWQEKDKLTFFLYLIAWPLILASIVSFFIPLIQPKRIIFLLPFFYLFVSYIILGSRHNWRHLNFWHWGSLLFLFSLNIFSLQAYYTQTIYQRENWRFALKQLHQQYPASDTIAIFAYEEPFSPWVWYEKNHSQPFPTLTTGNYDTSAMNNLEQVLTPALNYQYIIIFDYLRSLTDAQNLLPLFFQKHYYFLTYQLQYDNLGIIRLYARILPNMAEKKGYFYDENRH